MKRSIIVPVMLLVLSLGGVGCSTECEPGIAACSEKPPTDEECDAYFERWFYIEKMNGCEKVGYSGCSLKGFATQEECEACRCD
jgi:hypothetical protein